MECDLPSVKHKNVFIKIVRNLSNLFSDFGQQKLTMFVSYNMPRFLKFRRTKCTNFKISVHLILKGVRNSRANFYQGGAIAPGHERYSGGGNV